MIMNSITLSKESEDKSGQSVKYEAYDPNQEVKISSKGLSLDSYKKWGHLNYSKEDTSKHTIEEGRSNLNSRSITKKLTEEERTISQIINTSNKSPASIVNYITSSMEKSIPFHFMEDRKTVKKSIDLVREDKQIVHSIEVGMV
jgi:hypothetical protein